MGESRPSSSSNGGAPHLPKAFGLQYQGKQDSSHPHPWWEAARSHREEKGEGTTLRRLQEAPYRHPFLAPSGVQSTEEAQALDQPRLWRLEVRQLRAHADRACLPHRGAEVREAGAGREDVGHQGAHRQEDQEEVKRMLVDESSLLAELRSKRFG